MDHYLYKLDANNLVISTGLLVPQIVDPNDATKTIPDQTWITARQADYSAGVSTQSIPLIFSDFNLPKYIFDPNQSDLGANITERNLVTVIKASQRWKDHKKSELRVAMQREFATQEESKYHTLKAMKADGATLPQADLDFITAFQSWRTTRLAQYETDKTTHGIT